MPSRASKPNKDTAIVSDGRLRDGEENEGIEVGSATWFEWLRGQKRFYFECDAGSFTARCEKRRNGTQFWFAYRSAKGHLYNAYLGRVQQLALDKLWETAFLLNDKIRRERAAPSWPSQASEQAEPTQAKNLEPGALAILKPGYATAWKRAYGKKSLFKDGETVVVHRCHPSRNGGQVFYIIHKIDDPRRFGAAPEGLLLIAAALLEKELATPLQERDIPRQTLEWIHILEPQERETLVRGARHLVKNGAAANLDFANLEAYGDSQVMTRTDWHVIKTLLQRKFLATVTEPQGRTRHMLTPIGILAARLYAATPMKALKVRLYLRVERNNSYVRGRKRAREHIINFFLPHYDAQEEYRNGDEFTLTIQYQSDQDLNETVNYILGEIADTADAYNCFSESEIVTLDGDRFW